ncbi:MAG TPA: sigma-70 family RNA polymerase sigma factor [Acidimicrobiia bacterium]|nr:sigma-70 family RNA polymerase sigma factor [Acidimicrobiia bacterium]
MATQATTTSLVDGARAGDERAWQRIVTDYGPRIRGYARARGVADPDDLTQDVFTAAATQIGSFDGDDERLRSWLFAIAYRQIVNRYRASAKQTTTLPDTLLDPNGSPEEAVVRDLEGGEAVAALDVLSQLERDVVLMRVVGDMDSKEVAAAVGKRPGNVRVIQSRAMTKLRGELERRGYGAHGLWVAALLADVVRPIRAAEAATVAAAGAASAASAGTAGGFAGAASTVAAAGSTVAVGKVAAVIAIVTALGAGTAAVTGNLPAPAQQWIAEVARGVGIDLPHPEQTGDPVDDVSNLPEGELRHIVPGTSLPDLTDVEPQVLLPAILLP